MGRLQVFVRFHPDADANALDSPRKEGAANSASSASLSGAIDEVFGAAATQQQVYLKCARPLVDACALQGANGTLLTYGAWGAGKSYTLGCLDAGQLSPALDEAGILTRSVIHLFRLLGQDASVTITCIEVVGDDALDLLATTSSSPRAPATAGASASGSPRGGWGAGAAQSPQHAAGKTTSQQPPTAVVVNSMQEALAVLRRALARRLVAVADGRRGSSVSHAVLQLRWTFKRQQAAAAAAHEAPATSGAAASSPAKTPGSARASKLPSAPGLMQSPAKHGSSSPATASQQQHQVLLTFVDLAAPSALMLPAKAAASMRRGLLSLSKALAAAHLGETAMMLRESRLTRALTGSLDHIVLVVCLSGRGGSAAALTSPTAGGSSSRVGGFGSAGGAAPHTGCRSPTSPGTAGAAAGSPPPNEDEPSLQLIKLLTAANPKLARAASLQPKPSTPVLEARGAGAGATPGTSTTSFRDRVPALVMAEVELSLQGLCKQWSPHQAEVGVNGNGASASTGVSPSDRGDLASCSSAIISPGTDAMDSSAAVTPTLSPGTPAAAAAQGGAAAEPAAGAGGVLQPRLPLPGTRLDVNEPGIRPGAAAAPRPRPVATGGADGALLGAPEQPAAPTRQLRRSQSALPEDSRRRTGGAGAADGADEDGIPKGQVRRGLETQYDQLFREFQTFVEYSSSSKGRLSRRTSAADPDQLPPVQAALPDLTRSMSAPPKSAFRVQLQQSAAAAGGTSGAAGAVLRQPAAPAARLQALDCIISCSEAEDDDDVFAAPLAAAAGAASPRTRGAALLGSEAGLHVFSVAQAGNIRSNGSQKASPAQPAQSRLNPTTFRLATAPPAAAAPGGKAPAAVTAARGAGFASPSALSAVAHLKAESLKRLGSPQHAATGAASPLPGGASPLRASPTPSTAKFTSPARGPSPGSSRIIRAGVAPATTRSPAHTPTKAATTSTGPRTPTQPARSSPAPAASTTSRVVQARALGAAAADPAAKQRAAIGAAGAKAGASPAKPAAPSSAITKTGTASKAGAPAAAQQRPATAPSSGTIGTCRSAAAAEASPAGKKAAAPAQAQPASRVTAAAAVADAAPRPLATVSPPVTQGRRADGARAGFGRQASEASSELNATSMLLAATSPLGALDSEEPEVTGAPSLASVPPDARLLPLPKSMRGGDAAAHAEAAAAERQQHQQQQGVPPPPAAAASGVSNGGGDELGEAVDKSLPGSSKWVSRGAGSGAAAGAAAADGGADCSAATEAMLQQQKLEQQQLEQQLRQSLQEFASLLPLTVASQVLSSSQHHNARYKPSVSPPPRVERAADRTDRTDGPARPQLPGDSDDQGDEVSGSWPLEPPSPADDSCNMLSPVRASPKDASPSPSRPPGMQIADDAASVCSETPSIIMSGGPRQSGSYRLVSRRITSPLDSSIHLVSSPLAPAVRDDLMRDSLRESTEERPRRRLFIRPKGESPASRAASVTASPASAAPVQPPPVPPALQNQEPWASAWHRPLQSASVSVTASITSVDGAPSPAAMMGSASLRKSFKIVRTTTSPAGSPASPPAAPLLAAPSAPLAAPSAPPAAPAAPLAAPAAPQAPQAPSPQAPQAQPYAGSPAAPAAVGAYSPLASYQPLTRMYRPPEPYQPPLPYQPPPAPQSYAASLLMHQPAQGQSGWAPPETIPEHEDQDSKVSRLLGRLMSSPWRGNKAT